MIHPFFVWLLRAQFPGNGEIRTIYTFVALCPWFMVWVLTKWRVKCLLLGG